jgi:hypothetical protein
MTNKLKFVFALVFPMNWGTSNIEHRTSNIEGAGREIAGVVLIQRLPVNCFRTNFSLPLNPDELLTPSLSSFWRGEGDGSRGLASVQGFNARDWLRGILSPSEREKFCHVPEYSATVDSIQRRSS